jgi:sugar (glycoside-pentoside-hexuronide) transporter
MLFTKRWANTSSASSDAVPSMVEKIGYGLGGFGNALVQQTVTFFYLLYLTDTVGLAPAATGLLFLIARIFDAGTDPLTGYLIDHWRPMRWLGRLRSWLLIGAPLLTGMLILLFSMPDAPMQSLLIWVYVSYILAGIAFDFSTLSYTALMPAITQNPHQRSLLASFRITGSALATLLLALAIFAESDRLTGEREAWTRSAVTVAGIALIALLACAATVQERVPALEKGKLGWRDALKLLACNRPLLIILMITLGGFAAFAASGASWIFFFRYAVGNQNLFGLATLVGIVAAVSGAWIALLIASRYGKKSTMALGLGVSVLSRVWLFFIPLDNLPLIFLNRFLQDVSFGIAAAMLFSMLADTVEYAQWRMGVRSEGLISAAYIFTTKLATGVGVAVPAAVLQLSSYLPNVEQSTTALQGIVANVSLVPAACLLFGLFACLYYNLAEEQY